MPGLVPGPKAQTTSDLQQVHAALTRFALISGSAPGRGPEGMGNRSSCHAYQLGKVFFFLKDQEG